MCIAVAELRTEYRINPLGIDAERPRLSWVLESSEPGRRQAAYRILVASSREKLLNDKADLWDSGCVESGRSVHVRYEGRPLSSGQVCYWKVRVWDESGNASRWSRVAFWSMGLLRREDWKGKWIGRAKPAGVELLPAVYLRKEIRADKPVRRAVAYAAALGVYEWRLNGRRVGDDRFAPGWTDYHRRIQYQTYDVTALLRPGANAIGAVLGTGWYCGQVGMLGRERYGDNPFFLFQLNVEFEDGSTAEWATDETWKVSDGPIVYSDIIFGEKYDARRERDGWAEPGFDDRGWEAPVVLDRVDGVLVAQVDPPVRVTEERLPVSVRSLPDGRYVFDMGQNMVGWVRLKAEGEPGREIRVRYAEMLNPDGTLYTENLRQARQEQIYVLKGSRAELEPHFTFHGFRYVEVSGLPKPPTLDAVIGCVVHSDNEPAGTLETSDVLLNRLWANISWGQRGNFLSVPTDCPQRDERLGWTGDAQIFARTACYLVNAARFYTKYIRDMHDAQQPSGAFTDTAPEAGWIAYKTASRRLKWMAPDNAGWGDAGVIIPWIVYEMYGDRDVLEESYDRMVRWVEYLKKNSDGLVRPGYSDYGDWLSIDADTPKEVIATAYFAYSVRLTAKTARVLGRTADAEAYEALFDDIRRAFCRAFVNEDGRVHGDTQTAYVLALRFELLPEPLRTRAAERLVRDICSRGDHLTTGFLGVGYLLPVLSGIGRTDVAYAVLKQDTFPSWLYSVRHGATTIWERWDGWTEEKGFQSPGMNSFNHYSLGSVGEWMFGHMAGIRPASPGFEKVTIAPEPGGGLRFVRAQYRCPYGVVRSEWEWTDGVLTLRVRIPVNAEAEVWIPGEEAACDEADRPYVRSLGSRGGRHGFAVGSGEYVFRSRWAGDVHKCETNVK